MAALGKSLHEAEMLLGHSRPRSVGPQPSNGPWGTQTPSAFISRVQPVRGVPGAPFLKCVLATAEGARPLYQSRQFPTSL